MNVIWPTPVKELPDGYFTHLDIMNYRNLAVAIPSGGSTVEVGCFRGRSLCCLHDIIKARDIRVTAVDLWALTGNTQGIPNADNLAIFKQNLERFDLTKHVRIVQGKSAESAAMFADQSLDMAFIDADHSYESVKADILAYLPKIRAGGIIAGHDYGYQGWDGVKQAVDEIFGQLPCYGVWFKRKE